MAARGLFSDLRRRAVGFGLSCVWGLARICPWPVFRALTGIVYGAFYFLARRLSRGADESLTIAFGPSLSLSEKKRLARRSFFNLAFGFSRFLYSFARPGHAAFETVIEGWERLTQAQARGRGIVIAVAHFGPFVWMIHLLAERLGRAHVVMRPPRGQALRDVLLENQKPVGLRLIYSVPVRACVSSCQKALEAGEAVFMPIDQNFGGDGRIFVDFFGRKAATAAGPAVFAQRTGAVLLMAHCVPEGPGRYRIVIDPPLEPREGAEGVRGQMMLLTQRLEEMVRRHPDQWSWMHRRWKAVPREGEG